MSMLASLVSAYDRMAERQEVPLFGYSTEKISFVISLNEDGYPAGMPIDIREKQGRKLLARPMAVPQPTKRTSGIAPNFLWDKTSYVLGVTAGEGKRLADEHAAFVSRHLEALTDTEDDGLVAVRLFLQNWNPDQFKDLEWPEEMKDQNVVFALESERLRGIHIHDRPAAKRLWNLASSSNEENKAVCLVTGEPGPVARLHPAIKGVWGAQSSGASLVSFNLDAFTSYGHEQGDNAPVSEAAAFAYTTALNKLLENGSHNRVQIGDASTVFWADASDVSIAQEAENTFAAMFGADIDENIQSKRVGVILNNIRKGLPLRSFAPELESDVRFYVLGLAPNAARLSVRFWLESDFGSIAAHYQRFLNDIRIEPPPQNPHAPLWRYLMEMAVLGKRENVPPNLAGEWMRSILTGTNYPWTLLSSTLMRLRADKAISDYRAAILKAILVRNFNMRGTPVALDPENRNKGYMLGRLFAVYEHVQSAALGRNVNATIKDKFYGAASAQPRKVFALLGSGVAHHLSKVGKEKAGFKITLERQISEIMDLMSPDDDPFPAALPAEQQALFGLGYYHQRSEFFKSRKHDAESEKEAS